MARQNNTQCSVPAGDVWVLQQLDTDPPPMELFDMSSRSSDIGTSLRSEQESQTPRDFSPRNNYTYPLIPPDKSSRSPVRRPTATGRVISLHDLAAPFMAVLRIGGLYFELDAAVPKSKLKSAARSNGPHSLPTGAGISRSRPRSVMARILTRGAEPSESLSFSLCSLSLIVAIIDDGRLIYAFYKNWEKGKLTSLGYIVDNLVTIVWALQCLMVHLVMMVMCYQKRFAELFDAWEELRIMYPDSVVGAKAFDFNQKFRFKQKILIGTGFAALLLNCFSLIGPLTLPLSVYDEFREYVMFPWTVDDHHIMALIAVAFIFRSFDYVFTATLFLLLSDAIVLQFTLFYQDLASQISRDGILADAAQLEWHRLKHTKLCTLVKRVDAIFSPYVLIGLASGMFGILAQVYVIYDFVKQQEMNITTVLSYVYFCILNLAQVLVILWCGSKVHVAALLPLPKLYEIDQRSLSVQETQHLSVFLQKLSNCQTGYTALGIFTIDMTTILSLAGFYFTYQILLFQMRNDSSLNEKLNNIALPVDVMEGLRAFLNLTNASTSASSTVPESDTTSATAAAAVFLPPTITESANSSEIF